MRRLYLPLALIAIWILFTACMIPPIATSIQTLTPYPPTQTVVQSPASTPTVKFIVQTVEIPEWPEAPDSISWLDDDTVRAEVFSVVNGKVHWDQFFVDVSASSLELKPTPTPFYDPASATTFISPSGTYALICEKNTLELYRVPDVHLLGSLSLSNSDCQILPSWTQDESRVALVVSIGAERGYTIYVWSMDNSSPSIIGEIPDLKGIVGKATWSPDNQKIAIYIQDLTSPSPETENTYIIAYTDGRPMNITGASISHTWEVSWITNKIVDGGGSCCGSCAFHNYFIAETGAYIPSIGWADCGTRHPQAAQLSPDMHWFILDQSSWDFFDPAVSHIFTATLFDAQERLTYPLLTSSESYLDFVGWSGDSAAFYAVRRPMTATMTQSPESPFGLLVLNVSTKQFQLLNEAVSHAWLSPDRERLFGYSQTSYGLAGAIYNLSGVPLTPLQPILDHNSLEPQLGETGSLGVTWANDSRQVAFTDQWGNLWQANINGSIRQLAANLPPVDPGLFTTPLLYWSPDDDYLLVQSNLLAWVVYLTK